MQKIYSTSHVEKILFNAKWNAIPFCPFIKPDNKESGVNYGN